MTPFQLPSNENLDIRLLETMLSDQYITLSYKLFWFQGILRLVEDGKNRLSFKEIVHEMVASAWYMVTEYKLQLGYKDTLQKLILYIQGQYGIPSNASRKTILDFLKSTTDPRVIEMRKTIYNFVPYRLISPFFVVELRGISEKKGNLKNLTIMELSQRDERALYRFTEEREIIVINEEWLKYIRLNHLILKGWLNYKLIHYLQKKNPNVPGIPFKLEPPRKRNLSTATKYWTEVGKAIPIQDIYIGKTINPENINQYGPMSMDHFIPWSFIMHDELWNLIPSFKNVNSMKSNSLPDLKKYFDSFCELQYRGIEVALGNKNFSKLLEDYLTVASKETFFHELKSIPNREGFCRAMKDTIFPLHQIAYNQGFDIWSVDQKVSYE